MEEKDMTPLMERQIGIEALNQEMLKRDQGKWNLGKFRIFRANLLDLDWSHQVMRNMVVTNVDYSLPGAIEYTAYSELFEAIAEGALIPHYEITTYTSGAVTVRNIKY